MKFLLLSILGFMLTLTACTDNKKVKYMDEIQLKNGNSEMTFVFPVSYKAEGDNGKSRMRLYCKYPTMEARDGNQVLEADSMTIHLEVSESRSRADFIVETAAKSYDPNFPGKIFFVGEQDGLQTYRSFSGKGDKQNEINMHVFRAIDGALVSAEDSGDWSVVFTASRKIGPNLNVEYLFAKSIGTDFAKIDAAVVNFVNAHIKK